MAKSKTSDKTAGFKEVTFEGENASADYLKEQDEALLKYRATGERGVYVDTHRDQEPDIAPELGVHPDPAQANPAVNTPFATVASGPVVESFEDKEKAAKDAEESAQAAADEFNEANKDNDDVKDLSKEDALNLHLVPDESPKATDTRPGT